MSQKFDLTNATYDLFIDCESLQFRLLPTNRVSPSSESKLLKIKTLNWRQIQKFGHDIDESNFLIKPGSFTKCFVSNCRNHYRLINGLCFQHPLVFVKENRPKKFLYHVNDTIPEFMFVGNSSIEEAGIGVFAKSLLPAGLVFGPYAGVTRRILHDDEWVYSWQKTQPDWSSIWVDAQNEFVSNWMRYVNCARFEEEQNIVPCFFGKEMYYYTYKPVHAGEELLTWYGKDYAIRLGISLDYPDGICIRNIAPPKGNVN